MFGVPGDTVDSPEVATEHCYGLVSLHMVYVDLGSTRLRRRLIRGTAPLVILGARGYEGLVHSPKAAVYGVEALYRKTQ